MINVSMPARAVYMPAESPAGPEPIIASGILVMVACLVLEDIMRVAYRNAIYNYESFYAKDKQK
jgi:hypothetical protein